MCSCVCCLLADAELSLQLKSNEESEDATICVKDASDSHQNPKRSNCLWTNCENVGSGFGSADLRMASFRNGTTILSSVLNPYAQPLQQSDIYGPCPNTSYCNVVLNNCLVDHHHSSQCLVAAPMSNACAIPHMHRNMILLHK